MDTSAARQNILSRIRRAQNRPASPVQAERDAADDYLARHDSGDPFEWGERLIAHYEHNRVDPRSRTLVFSDALTFPLMASLYKRFKDRAKVAFGIGTNLTNDLGDPPAHVPLQIVIKMVRCNGQPVAKLSDTPAKNMCDDEAYLQYLRQVFEIRR